MIGAVAVGMFAQPELGLILALAHYLSCLVVGFTMRFYNPSTNNQNTIVQDDSSEANILTRAFKKLYQAQREDGRSFGQLLGDSIKESVNTLLLIGGFIIFFSVLTQILADVGFTKLISTLLSIILQPLNIKRAMILPLIGGLFEITNGSNLASQAAAPLNQQLIITSGIIAWSGLSVHAQVMTMINETDLRIKPYLWARVLHGILASLITYLLIGPGNMLSNSFLKPIAFNPQQLNIKINYLGYISQIGFSILFILISAIFLSLLIHLVKRITIISFHYFS